MRGGQPVVGAWGFSAEVGSGWIAREEGLSPTMSAKEGARRSKTLRLLPRGQRAGVRGLTIRGFSPQNVDRNRASAREQRERIAELVDRERSANVVVCNRILGHRGMFSFRRFLHERQPAGRRDLQEPLHSVVAAAGEHNTHDAGSVRAGGRNEQRIHCRSRAMFSFPTLIWQSAGAT